MTFHTNLRICFFVRHKAQSKRCLFVPLQLAMVLFCLGSDFAWKNSRIFRYGKTAVKNDVLREIHLQTHNAQY